MIEKLDMKSIDITQENIKKIQALFPDAVTEVKKDGKVTLAIDFDVLKQDLSDALIEEKQERYQMTWPEKSKARALANSRISATLRPIKEKSVDFDNTKNLYIEGDNLDVLKLLRETYLGKVKMIYIDPPYNTGNDFVYEDDFAQTAAEYSEISGDYDDQGNRLFKNTDSNGRFHTDWLNMIYPRLKLAKDMLTDDGVIFISIDDNEIENLYKLCDEIYGESNHIATFVWQKRTSPDARKKVSTAHEYILLYSKDAVLAEENMHLVSLSEEDANNYSNPDNDPRGPWVSTDFGAPGYRPNQMYKIVTPGGAEYIPSDGRCWKNTEEGFLNLIKEGRMWFGSDGKGVPRKKLYLSEREGKNIWTWWDNKSVGHTQEATQQFAKLMGSKTFFDYSKPVRMIQRMIQIASEQNSIILDFFSGSATTAHAVMQLNAEDGGNRKFIMVQLPEVCDEKSEAYKAGHKTICDIGEERIRRAGNKIKEEAGMMAQNLDIGFRVLKLDSSNMQDVYYNPAEVSQSLLDTTVDNIKPDRAPLDLLFQVMLDLGVELSAKIEKKTVFGKTFYMVNENDLIACFDDNLTNEVITEIAKLQPLYAAFKDKSFATDSVGINNEQIFKTFSPATVVKVI